MDIFENKMMFYSVSLYNYKLENTELTLQSVLCFVRPKFTFYSETQSVPKTRTLNNELNRFSEVITSSGRITHRAELYLPAPYNRTSGLNAASSSFCCRRTCSSYSANMLSNRSHISSATAVSRWLTKSLMIWTLDILLDKSEKLFLPPETPSR